MATIVTTTTNTTIETIATTPTTPTSTTTLNDELLLIENQKQQKKEEEIIKKNNKENLSNEELELLAKLEEQNRLLETDMKSLNSLQSQQSNHSRRSSETSETSSNGGGGGSGGGGTTTTTSEQQLHNLLNDNGNGEDIYQIWGQIINDWQNIYKKQKNLIQDLVRKGIPENLRGLVWQLLCNVYNQRQQIREKYSILIKLSSPCEKIIKRDIPRTYPELDFFKEKDSNGQLSLFNVMKVYSLFDQEVGYCQGSAFVVGLLLLNMPEEDAFTVFHALMYDYRLREMFKPTMAELGLCIYQLECLIQELLPELFNHFQQQNFHTSMYASSWFLTLFTSNLSIELSTRIMDLFLSEGLEIIFRLSIAILQLCRDDLLKLDMEGLLKYFQKEMPIRADIDPDYLINLAVLVKFDQKKMKKLAKDYSTIKAKEQEELVELRRLRTENRLLRQRIDNLEQESGELADKLIQGQVSRAQEAEDNFVIKRELSALKLLEQELRLELEQATNTIIELKEKKDLNHSLENKENQQLIESLQEELIAVKLRDAENHEEMKQLRERLKQQDNEINHLRSLPSDHVTAKLQDELLAIKLREQEANLSIKELKEKILELKQLWLEHMNQMHPESCESSQPNSLDGTNNTNGNSNSLNSNSLNSNNSNSNSNSLNHNSLNGSSSSTTSTLTQSLSVTSSPLKILNAVKRSSDQAVEINKLKTELMSTKLREAELLSDLKELRQKIMELETQNNVTMNQIRRQADEMKKLQQLYDEQLENERQSIQLLNKEKSRYSDLDFQMKEQQMMLRIKELEHTQLVAELRQKISSLETKIEEHVTKSKLDGTDLEPQNCLELSDRMAELQTEMFRLDCTQKKLNSMQQKHQQQQQQENNLIEQQMNGNI